MLPQPGACQSSGAIGRPPRSRDAWRGNLCVPVAAPAFSVTFPLQFFSKSPSFLFPCYGTDEYVRRLPSHHTNTHYVRSITSNSASFPHHEARFLTEPEMGAKRNGEARTATSVAGAAIFRRNRVPRVCELHENERRRRPWRYKKLEGRCQHMDGNATRGTEGERGERVARSLALRRNRAAAPSAASAAAAAAATRHGLRALGRGRGRPHGKIHLFSRRSCRSVPRNTITVSKA